MAKTNCTVGGATRVGAEYTQTAGAKLQMKVGFMKLVHRWWQSSSLANCQTLHIWLVRRQTENKTATGYY